MNAYEVFSEDEFVDKCNNRPRRASICHKRRSGRYVRTDEEYSLTVGDTEAILDFGGRFEQANISPERDLIIGETKILFEDAGRTTVRKVLWRDKGAKQFLDEAIAFSWQGLHTSRNMPPFRIPSTTRKMRCNALAVLRPGQLRFRQQLLKVYGQRCCITGFDVEETLEAAHIVPYQGVDSDHVQNGLLVRADLHRLFDALLISINPKTYKVHLAAALKKHSVYSDLQRAKLQLPKNKGYQPATNALRHHWNRFRRST